MYRVGVSGTVRVRHALVGDFGPETLAHEHEYRVEWTCRASALDPDGFAVDIAKMERARDAVLSRIGGVLLNELPFFAGRQPSLENFAAFLARELDAACFGGGDRPVAIEGIAVRIWENDDAWASYEED